MKDKIPPLGQKNADKNELNATTIAKQKVRSVKAHIILISSVNIVHFPNRLRFT